MWYKKNKYKLEYKEYVFHYDTVEELATYVMESGCKMPNPYEPNTFEFDLFNEVRWGWEG